LIFKTKGIVFYSATFHILTVGYHKKPLPKKNDKEEILITFNDLAEITNHAKNNPHLKDPHLYIITKKYSDIMKISPIHELILINGNNDTGFEHIRIRHEQWINRPKWIDVQTKTEKDKNKLQDQSLFRKDSTPIVDYLKIADSLYTKENLQTTTKNEQFDLYKGLHTHSDNETPKYKLLLYKDSKIIHTLYPQSNKNIIEEIM
jgi:hypothetical protein